MSVPTVDEIARRQAAEVVGGQLSELEISDIKDILTEAKAEWEQAQREKDAKITDKYIYTVDPDGSGRFEYDDFTCTPTELKDAILNAGKED